MEPMLRIFPFHNFTVVGNVPRRPLPAEIAVPAIFFGVSSRSPLRSAILHEHLALPDRTSRIPFFCRLIDAPPPEFGGVTA